MQKDFHYFAIAVLCRAAGFNPADALTIAYASQYVDNATESELIRIDIGGGYLKFDPVCTCYQGLDAVATQERATQEDARPRAGKGAVRIAFEAEIGAARSGSDIDGVKVQIVEADDLGIQAQGILFVLELLLDVCQKQLGRQPVPQVAADPVRPLVNGHVVLSGRQPQRASQPADPGADDGYALVLGRQVVAVRVGVARKVDGGFFEQPHRDGPVRSSPGAHRFAWLVTQGGDDAGKTDRVQVGAIGQVKAAALDLGHELADVEMKRAGGGAKGRLAFQAGFFDCSDSLHRLFAARTARTAGSGQHSLSLDDSPRRTAPHPRRPAA